MPTTRLVKKQKKIIQDMGNVELFESCETVPKVHCRECLLYWNQGIVYCTCGYLLRENQSNRSILQWTLDLTSIPNYVIKKWRPMRGSTMRHLHVGLLHFLLFAENLLSYRPVFPPGQQLHLPRCGGQIPCALQLMKSLTLLSSTTLSHDIGHNLTS